MKEGQLFGIIMPSMRNIKIKMKIELKEDCLLSRELTLLVLLLIIIIIILMKMEAN